MFSAQLHPEFGYFCPSSRVRRGFWAALVFALLGLIAGAGSMRSIIGHDADSESQLIPAYAEPAADGANVPAFAAPTRLHAARPQLTVVGGSKTDTAKLDPAKACEQMTWAYLDGKCVAGKTRKPRVVRVPTHRPAIALIPLGRNVSAGTDIGASKAAAGSPDATDGKPSAKSAKSAAADTASAKPDAPMQAFAAAKKPQRTAQSRSHRRSRVADQGSRENRAYRFGWRGTAQAMGYSGWSW